MFARDDHYPSLDDLRRHAKKLRPRAQGKQYQAFYNKHMRVSAGNRMALHVFMVPAVTGVRPGSARRGEAAPALATAV